MKRSNRLGKGLRSYALTGVVALVGVGLWQGSAWSFGGAETAVVIPAPAVDEPAVTSHSETAIFAGGCFWGVQGSFSM